MTETTNVETIRAQNLNDRCNPNVIMHRKVTDHMRKHWMDVHAGIIREAKAAQLKAVRDEWCSAFGVECTERYDDKGGSSIMLAFPEGFDEDTATHFAVHCLDMDVSERFCAPGGFFQHSYIGTCEAMGGVYIRVSFGLDI